MNEKPEFESLFSWYSRGITRQQAQTYFNDFGIPSYPLEWLGYVEIYPMSLSARILVQFMRKTGISPISCRVEGWAWEEEKMCYFAGVVYHVLKIWYDQLELSDFEKIKSVSMYPVVR